jgi:threonine/homoserine/homoserine lactone efflux protein
MFAQGLISGPYSGSSLFFISAVIGFAAALPLGPISILTIQRAMTLGFWRAFWPTLGAIAADGLFGVFAALGSGFLTSFILGNSFWLKLVGSGLLLTMGAKLLTLRPIDRTVSGEDFSLLQLTALNFTLVLSNPLTLAFFLAAFTFMGLDSGRHIIGQSIVMGAGITFGTLLWFVFICGTAGIFHKKVGDLFLNRARAGVGGLFVIIALLSAASVLMAG